MARLGVDPYVFEVFDDLTTHRGRVIFAEYHIRRQIVDQGYFLNMVYKKDIKTAARFLVSVWTEARIS